ncbi:hypothetical protein ACFQGT_00735 [Natrialbaceae archaeon GCM10025810]|uniref:hypothetical protein n=1 Tax=Halovalidus salilacus TaxID=3075124 RepID=UPI00361CE2FE
MIVVVPAAPPRAELVPSTLVDATPLTEAEAARLTEAALIDVLRAAASSGGDLLVNYRDEETLPDEYAGDGPEAELRAVTVDALGGTDDVRFERQVGSTLAARIGNTVTHLLEREGAQSVGICDPTAPLVARTEIDGAAMALRRHDVVLGPTDGGEVYFSGFAEPIDFEDAYGTPALSTLARRVEGADLSLGFAPMLPTITSESGLASTIAGLEARLVAGRPGGEATAEVVADLGLYVALDGSIEIE